MLLIYHILVQVQLSNFYVPVSCGAQGRGEKVFLGDDE